MTDELKILGEQPRLVRLADKVQLHLYPPTLARLQEVIEAALKIPDAFKALEDKDIRAKIDDGDDNALAKMLADLITDVGAKAFPVLRIMCADRAGEVNPELKEDNFWLEQVTTSAITELVTVWIGLTRIDEMLKNVGRLTGMMAPSRSRGPVSLPSSPRRSVGS